MVSVDLPNLFSLARDPDEWVASLPPAIRLPVKSPAFSARLPEALELIEAMIEQCARFETYMAELRAVRDSGMSFQQWQHMAPADTPSGIGVVYVLVAGSPG